MLLFEEDPFLGRKGKSLIDRDYGNGGIQKMKPAITIEIDHQLKILPQYFQAVSIGDKTFEIRKNDRDFKVGDNIALSEYEDGQYTGRSILAAITYIVFGIKTNFDLVHNPSK